jgi:uncharacterized protein
MADVYAVEVLHNIGIPARDGLRLSANLWLPRARAGEARFPAILEMIPYRKDDWRYAADHQRGEYFARHGFAFCRLDIRGTGSSPGIARDEYTEAETQDGYDAVEWLAAQPWCSGAVGMWGISYGGFTAIQVAMLRPPSLKAIVPVMATDDRYTDDVHYNGGCKTASELAQYALGMVAMNALPPRAAYADDWAARYKERLEQTPPWLIEWLRQQADGPYWRRGSLAPDYGRIACAIFSIGGWADSYVTAALRMHEKCSAPRITIVGPWSHSLPDHAYPGPNVDYLREMRRFFDYWLKGIDSGVMDGPALRFFRQQYSPPERFPARMQGEWAATASFPAPGAAQLALALGAGALLPPVDGGASIFAGTDVPAAATADASDSYPHRPTHGARTAALCFGAGAAPNGLAIDMRADEALCLTYTSPPLEAALDVLGTPEAVLFLSSSAPVAHVVVRLCDVAPDGTSAHVCTGILNLTHRDSHAEPAPLEPGRVYEVRVRLRAIGYRFLAGQRLRLSVASAYWPAIFPSPEPAENRLHRGPAHPSRLELPVLPSAATLAPPALASELPELIAVGDGSEEPPVWQVVEDMLAGSVTVHVYGGDLSSLPEGRQLRTSERIALTAFDHDPAHASLTSECVYALGEPGYEARAIATGTIRADATHFHIDVALRVLLNGSPFFQRSWLESVPRKLC